MSAEDVIADLRAALRTVVMELAYEAGQRAADDPERSAHLMAVAADADRILLGSVRTE